MNIHAVGPEQANALRLAPWGHPPTPLLPRWYRENFAHHRLPARIRRLNPAVARIGDLGTFWVQFQRPLDKASIRSLAHLAGKAGCVAFEVLRQISVFLPQQPGVRVQKLRGLAPGQGEDVVVCNARHP